MAKTLTASAIRSYLTCPRKYEFSYVENIRRDYDSDALRFGSLFHNVFEWLDLDVPWDEICRRVASGAASDVEAQQVLRLTAAHHDYHDEYEVESTEHKWHQDIAGVECRGMIDRVIVLPDGRRAVQEYKTSGEDISPGSMYWKRLRMDIQVSMYLVASGADTIIYDVTRKPTIRQKKSETVQEYGERLTADVQSRPEYYFQRQEIARTDQDVLDTLEDIRGVDRLVSLGVYPRNTSACCRFGTCEYFELCSNGHKPADGAPAGFVQLTTSHPELDNAEPTTPTD